MFYAACTASMLDHTGERSNLVAVWVPTCRLNRDWVTCGQFQVSEVLQS